MSMVVEKEFKLYDPFNNSIADLEDKNEQEEIIYKDSIKIRNLSRVLQLENSILYSKMVNICGIN